MTFVRALTALFLSGLVALPAFAAGGAGEGVDPIIFRFAIHDCG